MPYIFFGIFVVVEVVDVLVVVDVDVEVVDVLVNVDDLIY